MRMMRLVIECKLFPMTRYREAVHYKRELLSEIAALAGANVYANYRTEMDRLDQFTLVAEWRVNTDYTCDHELMYELKEAIAHTRLRCSHPEPRLLTMEVRNE